MLEWCVKAMLVIDFGCSKHEINFIIVKENDKKLQVKDNSNMVLVVAVFTRFYFLPEVEGMAG